MIIESLSTKNFRNLFSENIEFCKTANIIYGNNGQGKTNLIEAIWLMTGNRSFRSVRDAQMIAFSEQESRIDLLFYAEARQQEASLSLGSKRQASLNGVKFKSTGELAGRFCAVVFSPDDLTLVKEGPSHKRHFIDTAIGQIKPKYARVLSEYTRALNQRNALLKDLHQIPALIETLDVWDKHVACLGSILIQTRVTFVKKLCTDARESYRGISKGSERFDMTYQSSIPCDISKVTRDVLQQVYLETLLNSRKEDIRAMTTTRGAHRDDLLITLDDRDVRSYASQGQQRSCVLSLKLAECKLMRDQTGEPPVVLLDDVMSELDETRREYLLNHMKDQQVILTCCDGEYFKQLETGRSFSMKNGKIEQIREYSETLRENGG